MGKLLRSGSAPKGKFKGVNNDAVIKLKDLKIAAYHNALRLIDDAINAYKAQSYPTACFLAITAMEEYAKVWGVDFVLRNTDFYEREGQELNKVVDKWLKNHCTKLEVAKCMAIYSKGKETLGLAFKKWLDRNGYLNDLRTRSLYSGEWDKQIMEPVQQVGEEHAFEQICMSLELAIVALEPYYSLPPESGEIRESLEKKREENKLRTKLENFKAIRHNKA